MKTTVFAVAGFLLGSVGAFGQSLLGTTVTGDMTFPGFSSLNYFDPANGNVPAGYANVSSPTVTISGPSTSFAFSDNPGGNLDVATFTGTQLIITDLPDGTGTDLQWQMTFVDPAFAGLTLVSDSFPNGGTTSGITGDQITISWAGGPVTPTLYTATFKVASSVPEPSGEATMAFLGLAAAGMARFKRASIWR